MRMRIGLASVIVLGVAAASFGRQPVLMPMPVNLQAVAFSPDGTCLLFLFGNGTVQVCDARTGRMKFTDNLRFPASFGSKAITPHPSTNRTSRRQRAAP